MNDRSIVTYKRELDLTALEAAAYEMLLTVGPMTAKDMALGLDCVPSGVYRLLKGLQAKGYVYVRPGRPKLFAAYPVDMALQARAQQAASAQAAMQAGLLGSVLAGSRSPVVAMLNGRQALYDRYVAEASRAASEILVLAIGIAYNPELHEVQAAARARNVEVRHIIQQYDRHNYHVIDKWRRLGVKLRHFPDLLGFHLMIFDGRTVILTFSNPKQTEERTSLVLEHQPAASAMRQYFFDLWAKARLLSY